MESALRYFVTPWSWGGQAIAQRMPVIALFLLPVVFPKLPRLSSLTCCGLLLFSMVGVANTHLAMRGFNEHNATDFDTLIPKIEPGANVLYVSYDNSSIWVNAPVYTHAGAWFSLAAGGPYAFHFNRLISRYSDEALVEQSMIGKEFAYERNYKNNGEFAGIDPTEKKFWDTFVVHWPPDIKKPVVPFSRTDGFRLKRFDRSGAWGVIALDRGKQRAH